MTGAAARAVSAITEPGGMRCEVVDHVGSARAIQATAWTTEVAERAGNCVKVLLTVYATCLDGQRTTYNDHIATLLAE